MGSRIGNNLAELKTAFRKYMRAYQRVRRNLPECLEVFALILKHGKERQKSIWEMVNKIKRQSGALKKTRSTKLRKTATKGTARDS